MAKLPGFHFYPGDWVKDPNLRRCSHNAKGVLMDLLCLMFESDQRGVLATAGRAWTDAQIVHALGGDPSTSLAGLTELLDTGALSRNSAGAVFSRRMVREETERFNERTRKRRQREGLSRDCPAIVPPDVPPLSEEEIEIEKEGIGSGKGDARGEPAAPKLREPDPIWDIVTELFFPGGVRGPTKTRVGKIVRDLKELEATGEAVRQRYANLVAAWGGRLTVTPEALVKHWPTPDAIQGPSPERNGDAHQAGVKRNATSARQRQEQREFQEDLPDARRL